MLCAVENSKQVKKWVCICIPRVSNLDRVSRESFTEKVTFGGKKLKKLEKPCQCLRKCGRQIKYEGPKAGVCLVCLRYTQNASVHRAESERVGKEYGMRSEGNMGTDHVKP